LIPGRFSERRLFRSSVFPSVIISGLPVGGSVKPLSKASAAVLAILCVVLLVLAGCASSAPVATAQAGKEPFVPRKLAAVSFEKLTSSDASRMARCPVCGTVFRACDLAQNADLQLQELFLGRLAQSGGFSVIPPYQSDAVYQKVKGEHPRASVAQHLQMTGKALEVDGVLVGYVSCFSERVGYWFSAERPASVTFGVYLIRSSDGEPAWGNIFDKTQQSLFENVLQSSTFFSRGLQWVTVAELAEEGVDEILKTFPGYR